MFARCLPAILVTFALTASSCGSGGSSTPDARLPSDAADNHVTAAFVPPEPGAGADWGAIPYPSDLFLDSDGKLTLTSLPTGPSPDATAVSMLTEALHVMDGAGINSQVYFPVSGDVDNATLSGNVVLVDLDDGLTEIGVDLLFRPEIGAIMAAPLRGSLLEENQRYAAYVTNDVTDTSGLPLAPAPAFSEAIDLTTVPSDPAVAAAQENLRPLIEALDAGVVSKLVAATVFRTQHTSEDLVDMYNVVREITPSVVGDITTAGPDQDELDLIFGGPQSPDALVGADDTDPRAQPHSHVAVVLQASIDVPSFRNADPLLAGFMERDGDNVPIVKGSGAVRFTLALPKGLASYENIPVLLWVHGVNQTRGDMLTFTDWVNERGYAYVGMDLLYHGDRRAGAQDIQVNVTGFECGRDAENNPITPCDGMGDMSGLVPATQFFHMAPSGDVPAYHPRAVMENLRQAAIDLVSLNNFLSDGDLTPIITQLRSIGVLAADQTLSFKGDDIGVLTESLGAMPAILLSAVDPRVRIAFLASPANSYPYPLLFHSAAFTASFAPVTLRPWDVATRTTIADPVKGGRNEPIVMLWNSAIERGDAAAFARYLTNGDLRGDDGIDLIVTQTWEDEWVSNSAVEHLIGIMGLPIMKITRDIEPPDDLFRFVPRLSETAGPITGNAAGGAHTQVATLWYPAAHALLRKLEDQYDYEPDLVPVSVGESPFVERDEIWYFCNPVVNIHNFWGNFFAQHYAGETPTAEDPFPVAVPPGSPPCG